jgi:hypothetical protein
MRRPPDDPTSREALVTDGRTEDTPQRAHWREQAKARYRANPERKRQAVYRYRQEHPERFRESKNMARKRRARGVQRAWRKAPE